MDHTFHRLFTAPDSTARFLVADEVGLGKTLVARGVIARAIEHLWDTVERIDIVYICSNASIGRANLPKLQINVAGERSYALATRLTMLATQLAARADEHGPGQNNNARLTDSKLNFVSFTPQTSFDMGRSTGQRRERAVLFHLLAPLIDRRRRTALTNFLQGNLSKAKEWRKYLERDVPLNESIQRAFGAAFASRADLHEELETLFDEWFHRVRKQWPKEARRRRNALIGRLRQLLAEVCVHSLEPDLIILDEFQRFRHLLETREEYRDPAAELAQTLFRAPTPEGHPARVLLLSATPYKLYTADAEIDHEDHYQDFLATTRFLLDESEERVQDLQGQLQRFGSALKRAAVIGSEHLAEVRAEVLAAKKQVESTLRSVMARTERVAASHERDAMLEEPMLDIALTAADVRQYLAADALFRAVGDHDPMRFWKSAPYLLHFMRGYKARLEHFSSVPQQQA